FHVTGVQTCALPIFALSTITPDMATLWIGPRSHLLGVQPAQANTTTAPGHRESLYEPDNAIQLPTLQPGDACIFDRSTLHRSLQDRKSVVEGKRVAI